MEEEENDKKIDSIWKETISLNDRLRILEGENGNE